MDLEEALHFAAEGKVQRNRGHWSRFENINAIFQRLREATVEGRIVLDFAA